MKHRYVELLKVSGPYLAYSLSNISPVMVDEHSYWLIYKSIGACAPNLVILAFTLRTVGDSFDDWLMEEEG